MRIIPQSVELEYITPDAAELIERAGRTCYKSEDKITGSSAKKFMKMILGRGHHSVIEHPFAAFRVVCDRGVSHEFVRHRLMSFSQESTRYCNYGKGKFGSEITVIEPPGLIPEQLFIWKYAMEACEQNYMDLLKKGCPPQIARSVLPNSLKTELVATANFREWRHFLKLRTAPAAHPQMIEVASKIGDILMEHCPAAFEDVLFPQPSRAELLVRSLMDDVKQGLAVGIESLTELWEEVRKAA